MRHHRPILLVFLPFVAGYFLTYLFRSINALIAADLSSEFSLDPAGLGLLTSTFFVTFAAIQLPLGVWLDRYGPRRVQGVLLPVAAGGAVLFAAAQNLSVLMLGRALIGFGMAGALMAGLKALVQWFPKERLATINGCFVMIGALGAMAAATPAETLLPSTGWRGLFVILGMMTAACALLIYLVVPEPRSDMVGSSSSSPKGLKTIFIDTHFWRIAPLAATCIGTSWAMQGLWAASWLSDVELLDRPAVVRHLFLMAAALSVAALILGVGGDQLSRSGFSMQRTLTYAAMLFIVAQFAVVLRWPIPAYLLWSFIAGFGTATVLNYAILAERYPKELIGRANAALNVFQLGGAFVLQSVTGVIIRQWTGESGHYPAIAYQVAFVFNVSLQVMALVWFIRPERKRADAVRKTAAPHSVFRFEGAPATTYQSAALAWSKMLAGAQMQLRCWRIAALGSFAVVVLLGSGLLATTARSDVVPYVVGVKPDRANQQPQRETMPRGVAFGQGNRRIVPAHQLSTE